MTSTTTDGDAEGRVARARAAAQLLHRPSGSSHPADIARETLGMQAQEPLSGRLAFRCRNTVVRAADVDRARNEERSLVRTWVMRNTVHLLARDDADWMLPLYEPRLVNVPVRRLAHFGLDARAQDRAVDIIKRALGNGPLTRSELVEVLKSEGIEIDEARRVHLFGLATFRGVCVQGPDRGAQHTVVDRREWLGDPPPFDREAALTELTRRYLRAFGPASEADFAGWSGLPLGDVRAGLGSIASEIAEVALPGGEMGWRLRRRARVARGSHLRLLAAYDTYLMGHRNRDFIAAGERWRTIAPGGGILRATIARDGVALGTWGLRRTGKRVEVTLRPFDSLSRADAEAVEAEAKDVARFEGVGEARLRSE